MKLRTNDIKYQQPIAKRDATYVAPRFNNPQQYKSEEQKARERQPNSEIVTVPPYTTIEDGKIVKKPMQRLPNIGAGYVSGTDPIGEFVVGSVVASKPLAWLGKGLEYGAAKAGNQWARNRIVSREVGKQSRALATPVATEPKALSYQAVGHTKSTDNPSLKFFERPPKLTHKEKRGIPRGTRNQPMEKDYIKKLDINFKELIPIGKGSQVKVFESPFNANEVIKYPTTTLKGRNSFRQFKQAYVMRNNAYDIYEPSYYMGFVESKGGNRIPVFRQKRVTGKTPTYNAQEEVNMNNILKESGYKMSNSWTAEKNGFRYGDLHQENYKYTPDGKLKFFDLNVEKVK